MHSTPDEHNQPTLSQSPDRGRIAPASAAVGPWSLDKLAAVAGETEARLSEYADAGLLHQSPKLIEL